MSMDALNELALKEDSQMTPEQIKKLSKPFHDNLENNSINQKLFSHNANIGDYHRFLSLQYAIFSALDSKINHYLTQFSEYGIIYSLRGLEAKKELEAYGVPLPELSFDASFITDFSSALAALYIIEGSRHGAIVILKSIRSFMPSDYQFFFLQINPPLFMQQWKIILRTIEDYSNTQKSQNKLILDVCKLYLEIEGFYHEF